MTKPPNGRRSRAKRAVRSDTAASGGSDVCRAARKAIQHQDTTVRVCEQNDRKSEATESHWRRDGVDKRNDQTRFPNRHCRQGSIV